MKILNIEKAFGMDTLWGRLKFKRSCSKLIMSALIAGTIVTGFTKNVSALDNGQKEYIEQIVQILEAPDSNKLEKKKIDKLVNYLFKQFKDMIKTLQKELDNGEFKKAEETSKSIMEYAKRVGLEKAFEKRVKAIYESARELGKNKILREELEDVMQRVHKRIKEGKKIDYYNATISGENWRFQITYSPFGGGTKAYIKGEIINIKSVLDTINKLDITQDQKDHMKLQVLKSIDKDFPNVFIIAK